MNSMRRLKWEERSAALKITMHIKTTDFDWMSRTSRTSSIVCHHWLRLWTFVQFWHAFKYSITIYESIQQWYACDAIAKLRNILRLRHTSKNNITERYHGNRCDEGGWYWNKSGKKVLCLKPLCKFVIDCTTWQSHYYILYVQCSRLCRKVFGA